jgi:hypothetical protein
MWKKRLLLVNELAGDETAANAEEKARKVLWPGGTVPGFFVETQGFRTGSCRRWAEVWDAWDYEREQLVDTPLPVMLGIRVHDLERDREWWEAAVEEGTATGFQVHLNFMLGQLPSLQERNDLELQGVVLSHGNERERGAALVASPLLNELQDDSGIRGAVTNARHSNDRLPVNFHVYGRDGVMPAHLRLLRMMYPKRAFRLGELHWTHRQDGENRADRDDVYAAEAGAYCRMMVAEAARLGMPCCLFTGRDFMPAEGEAWPQSWMALTGRVQAKPNKPALRKQLDYAKSMLANAWGRGR